MDHDHGHVSAMEVLIQTVAEMQRGIKILRLEVADAVTGKRRREAPLATIDLLEANMKVMDALVPYVTDRDLAGEEVDGDGPDRPPAT